MFRKLLAFTVLVSLTIAACKKDESEDPSPNPPPGSDLWGQGVSASVYGTVIDENGNAVAGATVHAGNSTSTTDGQGVFRINGFSAYQNLGYVTVNKTGYFEGSRSFVPVSGGNRVNIRLLTNAPDGNVSAASGATISDANSAVEITLPANGIVKNNAPYTGNVRVAIRHIDTQSDNFSEEMPGNLIGVQNNQSRGLVSYGMVAAELTDNAGQPLQLATGQTATVRFPIAAQQQATAPASIDLWSFDEQNGYWKHEGTATKQVSEYVAQVSHFSFWNCDIPGNWITLQGTINSTTGQPIPGAMVTLNSQTSGTASDYTNAQGQFSGWVPGGQTLTMTVQVPCNGTNTMVLTQSIGPFSTNTTLSPIAVTIPGATQVTGTLVCNGNPVTNGYVIANGQVHFANAAGVFSFATCSSGTQLYPYGGSPLTAGTPVQIPANGIMNNVTVCSGGGGGTGTVTDIDGNTYNTVQIGTQEWMQENLKTTKYKNGDLIPTGLNNAQWQATTQGAWAYYNDSSQYNNLYGKLYNWYAVADPRGVCPTGWHVPTDSEWNQLVKYLDPQADTTIIGSQSQIAGGLMKAIGDLQSGTGLWQSPNTGATNISGFTGLPGGYRNSNGGYSAIGYRGDWWSSSEYNANSAWYRSLDFNGANVGRNLTNKLNGFSVRCLRD
ncbi:MAG: FISUMP domain-containing protein [Bacteroidota bacterium]